MVPYGTAVPGAISVNWTFIPSIAGNYDVYLNINDALNFKVQSNMVTLNVYSQPTVTINPASVNMTINSVQTFSSIATGGLGPYTYQWYLNGSQVHGAIGDSWKFNATTTGTYIIYLKLTDNLTSIVQSNNATGKVAAPLIVLITPTQLKMYVGQSQLFDSSISGGTAPYTYHWYLNNNPLLGQTSQTWNFTPTSTGNFSVYLNVTDSLNFNAQSNIVTEITVYSQLNVSISPALTNLTIGNPQTFTSNVSGGAQPYTYQWYFNGNIVSNANSSAWTYIPTSLGNFTIYLIVKDNNTQSTQSNVATVEVGNSLILTINTDRPRYIKWSYVTINVNVTDLLNGTTVQGASVNLTIYDTHGRLIWTKTGLTDTNGTAQLTYLLAFDAQFGNYTIDASVTADGYNPESIQTTFFSLG